MSSKTNRELWNFLIVTTIVLVILGIPFYLGMTVSVIQQYGFAYWKLMMKPSHLWYYFHRLFMYAWQNVEALAPSKSLPILLPPAIGSAFSLFTLFLARAPLIDFRPFQAPESIHGDAHWATEADIRRAKLRAKKGVLMGRTGKANYLIADDFQHILLFAPTGSGKGVGFVIPNLLFWDQSVVVHDIKLENYELSSGYRTHVLGQNCYTWNPADPNGVTHCYNPLDFISDKPGQMVDDCQKICSLILPEQEFWQNEARSLMLGVMLYLCAVPEKVTSFGEIVRTMRSDDVVYNLAVVLDTIGGRIHPVCYMNLASFLQKADKERSGCISTLNSGLELWSNPLIDTATASSDFSVAEFKKKAVTVFVGVTPDNLQRLEPLLKIFYQQATDFLTRHMPKPDEKIGVMFMLDEFPSLGEMPQFQVGIAYFRGFRVKLFLIVQDTQQLKGIYEEAGMNSFLSNSYYRITYSANNIETANMISQMIGNKTVIQESRSAPAFIDFNPGSRSKQISETQRALLLPQEVISLPRDDQIILIESFSPVRCKKIFYYKDAFFTKKLLDKTPLPIQEPYDPNNPAGPKKLPLEKPPEVDPNAASEAKRTVANT
ncbi:MAG: type IV secretion system protein VirD4 [Alphaproteobacteria bacterium]|nr:MAG: type IV secretion system protein VirD4 [Alphaproteobacteria bacterium]